MHSGFLIFLATNHHLYSLAYQVMPKPVLTPLNLSFPLASSDLGGSEAHEKEFMMNNLRLYEVCFSYTLFKFNDHYSLVASLP